MLHQNIGTRHCASSIGNAAAGARSNAGKLYLENTLLRVVGALFRHDGKRRNGSGEIVVPNALAEKTLTIRPDPRIGQPGPLAHKLFFALIKKHSDFGLPVRGQVSFSRREIMRLIGRKSWGGKDSEDLSRALHEIHYTFIRAQFKDSAGKWIEHSFNVFPEILIERRALASDPIEACTVTLAEPIIASLRDEHFTCLNHELMTGLSTIAQALYLRLFFHFANLYDGHNGERLKFPKRYDAICVEWLGGLSVRRHASKITDQLGAHLEALTTRGFLAGHTLTRAKNGDGFVVTFWPGKLFFADYDRFYGKGMARTTSTGQAGTERDISEPLKLASLFAEKRSGRKLASIAFISTRDRQTARELLKHLDFADMPDFIAFALQEADRTSFDVQTLGGIKQYLGAYLDAKTKREVLQQRQAVVKSRLETERLESVQQTAMLDRARDLFAHLSVRQQEEIRAEAMSKAAKFSGSLQAVMIEHHIAQITAGRHGNKLALPGSEHARGRAA